MGNQKLKVLEIRNLTKYFGGLGVLLDVNFDVFESEILGIIGPNGAGKSTLFNIITGLIPATAGRIRFNGENLLGLRPDEIAKRGIGRTFQLSTLFKQSTVFTNVYTAFHTSYKQPLWKAYLNTKAFREEDKNIREKTFETLDFVGLASQKEKMAENLSSGFQKVLCVGIALATNPKLLLLDEPVTTLSSARVEMIMELIDKVRKKGVTIMIIEHNMKAIMDYCDRIMVLGYGKKIAEGLPYEIRENKEVAEAYLGVIG